MTRNVTKSGRISRRRLLTTVSAGAALAAWPFRINLLQAQEAPIKIGFPVPLTGPYGTEAQDQVRAAQLAIAHDFVIMRADRGYWCLPEADLGLPLTPEMFAIISAKLPRRTAHEAITTARRYGGADAVAAGIAHRAVGADRVLADAITLAAELAGRDRRTLAEHKRLLYGEATRLCGAGIPADTGE